MTKQVKKQLEFGLNDVVPSNASAAWGARLIFPDDLVPNRQSLFATNDAARAALILWLNGDKAIAHALNNARKLAKRYEITPNQDKLVVLYEDDKGKIVANPNASYGYLYCAGWLHTA